MGELEEPKSCRTLSTASSRKGPNITCNSPLSSFMAIAINPQPKMRVKISKFIAKTIHFKEAKQAQGHHNSNEEDAEEEEEEEEEEKKMMKKKRSWAKPRNLLAKKFSSLIHTAFGKKKSSSSSSSSSSSCTVKQTDHDDDDKREEREGESAGSMLSRLSLAPAAGSTLSGHRSLREFLKHINKTVGKGEGKENKQNYGTVNIGGKRVVGEGSPNMSLARVSSRNQSFRRARLIMRKKVNQRAEAEKVQDEWDNNGEELCKKRILMGERCRPLNPSGALHYDEHGVLLPEEVHPHM